jgi:hypothetical protein
MFDNQKLAWASERENGSGREIRTVEYNFTRNQMFGEHVVTNDTGTVRVYTSSRYDYAVENNGGSATIFVNGNRYTINSQDSFPYSFFGTKAIMSATGSDILISSKGTGVIRRFNVVNGVLGEKGRLAFPGSGAGTLFGTDMAGDKTLSHVAVLAPNGPSYITILKYNSVSDQYVVHQIFATLPDINMQYSIGWNYTPKSNKPWIRTGSLAGTSAIVINRCIHKGFAALKHNTLLYSLGKGSYVL